MTLCGIDVGTQGARCVLVRKDCEVLAQGEWAFQRSASPLPQGWFEQDPQAWTDAVLLAVRMALQGAASSGGGRDVQAIGVDGAVIDQFQINPREEP